MGTSLSHNSVDEIPFRTSLLSYPVIPQRIIVARKIEKPDKEKYIISPFSQQQLCFEKPNFKVPRTAISLKVSLIYLQDRRR